MTPYLNKIFAFIKPIIPNDTEPQFSSNDAQKVTMALCSLYSGVASCRTDVFNPEVNSRLKRYHLLAPQSFMYDDRLRFRFWNNLYQVTCLNHNNTISACIAESVPAQMETNALTDEANNWNRSSLIEAIKNKDFRYVNLHFDLLDPDVNERDENGWTPLIHAAHAHHVGIVKLLLAKGAKVNMVDRNNCTALICAADQGVKEVVQLLLNNGADVNTRDYIGRTAVMHAILNWHPDIVALLFKYGADLNVRDKFGDTALSHARRNGFTDIVAFLERHGAKDDFNTKFDPIALILHEEIDQ